MCLFILYRTQGVQPIYKIQGLNGARLQRGKLIITILGTTLQQTATRYKNTSKTEVTRKLLLHKSLRKLGHREKSNRETCEKLHTSKS